MRNEAAASTEIEVRPIFMGDLAGVPGKCWEGAESQHRLLQAQEILGFAAWEGQQCVGQLHCYRVLPPQWDDEDFPSYGRRDPRSWPLGWPLQVAQAQHAAVAGPIWGHGCFHVGLVNGAGDADPRYFRRGIGTALCRASVQWASEHGYATILAGAGSALVPDFSVWMGYLPWKVYERLGFRCIGMEEDGTKLPWWVDRCPPTAQEQVRGAVEAGATARDLCARVMAMALR